MLVNSCIFNDMKNINNLWGNIDNPSIKNKLINEWSDVINSVAFKDIDIGDFKTDIKSKVNDGEDKDSAIEEVKMSIVNDFFASGMQIWFVPDDSLLSKGLKEYYFHIDKAKEGYLSEFKMFARSAIDSDDVDNPINKAGFFFITGGGYYINDELFANVPIVHRHQPTDGVGSGIPSKRFLYFLNYEDNNSSKRQQQSAKKEID